MSSPLFSEEAVPTFDQCDKTMLPWHNSVMSQKAEFSRQLQWLHDHMQELKAQAAAVGAKKRQHEMVLSFLETEDPTM